MVTRLDGESSARRSRPTHDALLLGRDAELDLLRPCATAQPGEARAVLLVGDAGMGKTLLLERTAARAESAGIRTLRVRGSRGETPLAFAGLHQLLRPVMGRAEQLPPRQKAALYAAFGLHDEDERPPDRLLLGLASLTLLSGLAAQVPLLIVVDDAHWIDTGSLEVLAFVSRRLEGEAIGIAAASRPDAVPQCLVQTLRRVPLAPLDARACADLLDAQPTPPSGEHRRRILRRAGGNPLALVELARSTRLEDISAAPLPLTGRLEDVFAAQLASVPTATRQLLVLAAAADTTDLSVLLDADAQAADAATWHPAEAAGLVHLDGNTIRFRHPLVRSAVYQSAPREHRRRAHLALAGTLPPESDRRAWHLAAAAFGPDDTAADALEETAGRAARQGAITAAAAALEQSALLTPQPAAQAGRMIKAANLLAMDDQSERAERLAARATALTDDPAVQARAAILHGWALSRTLRQTDALAVLLPTARALASHAPHEALQALSVAAGVAHQVGDAQARSAVEDVLTLIPTLPGDPDAAHLWARVLTDPRRHREDALKALAEAASAPAAETVPQRSPTERGRLTGLAWFLDETRTALELGRLANPLEGDRAQMRNSQLVLTLGWVFLDHGQWARAQAIADEVTAATEHRGAGLVQAYCQALQATLYALQGDTESARGLVAALLEVIDPAQTGAVHTRARWAGALASAAEGDHSRACAELLRLFTPTGEPLHYHLAPYAVADLAEAAARARRTDEARTVLAALRRSLPDGGTPRLRALTRHARAVLDDSGRADRLFQQALGDPRLGEWPYERARLQLAHGEWLRRSGQVNRARPLLAQARQTFDRLGATACSRRAGAELEAAGVRTDAEPETAGGSTGAKPEAAGVSKGAGGASPIGALSPQQRQIVRLAAEGMTNREIGERLFLSARTVAFHLYRAFPKLGVTSRTQLRDLLQPAGRQEEPADARTVGG